jgi:tetratricopeptide (TPR) repeat protein
MKISLARSPREMASSRTCRRARKRVTTIGVILDEDIARASFADATMTITASARMTASTHRAMPPSVPARGRSRQGAVAPSKASPQRRHSARGRSSATRAFVDANVVAQVAELEGGIQSFYLGTLLTILGGAGFIVVRQVLIRRELDDQAKKMGERIRAGNASAEDYFEMGSILLRKKVFTQAVRNLQMAATNWDGDEQDLALVHNALGFGYSNTDKLDLAVAEFKKSVALQPGYVTAWNNLGEAYEKKKEMKDAIACYEESLVLSPNNPVATERLEEIKMRMKRRGQLDDE